MVQLQQAGNSVILPHMLKATKNFKIQQTYIWEVGAVFAEPEHDESTVVDGGGVILPNAVVLLIDLSEFLLRAAATHTYHT